MNTEIVTSKFQMKNILGTAAVMLVVIILWKLFVTQYVASNGEIKTKFKSPVTVE